MGLKVQNIRLRVWVPTAECRCMFGFLVGFTGILSQRPVRKIAGQLSQIGLTFTCATAQCSGVASRDAVTGYRYSMDL